MVNIAAREQPRTFGPDANAIHTFEELLLCQGIQTQPISLAIRCCPDRSRTSATQSAIMHGDHMDHRNLIDNMFTGVRDSINTSELNDQFERGMRKQGLPTDTITRVMGSVKEVREGRNAIEAPSVRVVQVTKLDAAPDGYVDVCMDIDGTLSSCSGVAFVDVEMRYSYVYKCHDILMTPEQVESHSTNCVWRGPRSMAVNNMPKKII